MRSLNIHSHSCRVQILTWTLFSVKNGTVLLICYTRQYNKTFVHLGILRYTTTANFRRRRAKAKPTIVFPSNWRLDNEKTHHGVCSSPPPLPPPPLPTSSPSSPMPKHSSQTTRLSLLCHPPSHGKAKQSPCLNTSCQVPPKSIG